MCNEKRELEQEIEREVVIAKNKIKFFKTAIKAFQQLRTFQQQAELEFVKKTGRKA
jgi:hypothetical protein